MVAIDFPNAPVLNDEVTLAGMAYVWNGQGWITKVDSGGDFVEIAGDTMTGNLTITNTNPATILNMTSPGVATGIVGQKDGINQWSLALGDNQAPTGANTGNNFSISRYDDAGAPLGSIALNIERATGTVSMTGNLLLSYASPAVYLQKTDPAGSAELVSPRWHLNLDQGAAGDFTLNRYDDAGAFVSANLTIFRSTGMASFQGSLASGSHDVNYAYGGNLPYPAAAAMSVYYEGAQTGYGINFRTATATVPSFPAVFWSTAPNIVGTIATDDVATTYNTSSDERLKEDAQAFDSAPIIDATNVYDFKWKDSEIRAHGVIAQEAQTVYPEAVTYIENRDWYGVDYSRYVPILLNEVKALRARLAAVEAQLSASRK